MAGGPSTELNFRTKSIWSKQLCEQKRCLDAKVDLLSRSLDVYFAKYLEPVVCSG